MFRHQKPLPLDEEARQGFYHQSQLDLMAEQVHALQGAPLPSITPPPVDPSWKPPYIVLD